MRMRWFASATMAPSAPSFSATTREPRFRQKSTRRSGSFRPLMAAMSSKLASIGVLLAAYELGRREPKVTVGVAHVESQGYRVEEPDAEPSTTLFTMWLTGECYAA